MAGPCQQFARLVLEESRNHIMNGGFSPRVWAQWASVTHTSGNSLKVLRELSCNQRIDGESNSDSESNSDAPDKDAATDTTKPKLLVSNVMHPKYGRKFRPVPTIWTMRKEFERLRGGEGAQLAANKKKGATLSFKDSILASLRRAREDGSLINTAAADGVLESGEEFCVRALVAGDGFKAGSCKEVRIGDALLTTTGFNQSPNDWSDFCLYSGDESWSAIKSFMEPVLDEIVTINATSR
eukprot:5398922-Pleurochrysis_carterae.AAC.1